VPFDRIEEEDIEAHFSEMGSVCTWSATDIKESSRWRQVSVEDVPRPESNQIALTGLPQTSILIGQLVALKYWFVRDH